MPGRFLLTGVCSLNGSIMPTHGSVQIGKRHAGKVPPHGRLFAQWLHHAYPRECPDRKASCREGSSSRAFVRSMAPSCLPTGVSRSESVMQGRFLLTGVCSLNGSIMPTHGSV